MIDKSLRFVLSALLASVAILGAGAPARAAGGHHAVDDAAILDPGQCQFETWVDRERGGARTLLHLGPACRVGPVELGLNADRVHLSGAGSVTTAGPQVKWATAIDERLSAGIVVSASWQEGAPRYLGSTVVLPVTWRAGETLLVHVNAGRDLRAGADDENRAGVALEWAPLPAWSFVAERFRESRTNYWRAGARWVFTEALNVDLSHARSLDRGVPAWWTLGLTWAFDR